MRKNASLAPKNDGILPLGGGTVKDREGGYSPLGGSTVKDREGGEIPPPSLRATPLRKGEFRTVLILPLWGSTPTGREGGHSPPNKKQALSLNPKQIGIRSYGFFSLCGVFFPMTARQNHRGVLEGNKIIHNKIWGGTTNTELTRFPLSGGIGCKLRSVATVAFRVDACGSALGVQQHEQFGFRLREQLCEQLR